MINLYLLMVVSLRKTLRANKDRDRESPDLILWLLVFVTGLFVLLLIEKSIGGGISTYVFNSDFPALFYAFPIAIILIILDRIVVIPWVTRDKSKFIKLSRKHLARPEAFLERIGVVLLILLLVMFAGIITLILI